MHDAMEYNQYEVYTAERLWTKAKQLNFSSLVTDEYVQILCTTTSGTWKAFSKLENKEKNQSGIVPCWDHTRVILSSGSSDYIHANYVDGFRKKHKFICTQAPKANTFGSFWKMTWDEDSRIIVMLMALEPDKRQQCYPYLSLIENGAIIVDDFKIKTVKVVTSSHAIVTELCLTKKSSQEPSRQIFHFQYTDWTSNGIPGCSRKFYQFIRDVNKVHLSVEKVSKICQKKSGPIIVHCFAGIEKTGIFCATDIALFQMMKTSKMSLQEIVTKMRQQRYSIVVLPEQYCFCYRVVLYYTLTIRCKTGVLCENE